MQLSNQLPQFEGTPTLLLVVGWQHGKVFFAVDGTIELIDEVSVPDHRYSDAEGHFKTITEGASGAVRSGAPREPKKEHVRKEFLRQFMEAVDAFVEERSIKQVYLFSPPRGLQSLEAALSTKIRDCTESFYSGNYAHTAPDELVSILEKEQQKPISLMSEEAKKILDRDRE